MGSLLISDPRYAPVHALLEFLMETIIMAAHDSVKTIPPTTYHIQTTSINCYFSI